MPSRGHVSGHDFLPRGRETASSPSIAEVRGASIHTPRREELDCAPNTGRRAETRKAAFVSATAESKLRSGAVDAVRDAAAYR